MTTVTLSMINLRINQEIALSADQTFINTNPDFQREYDAWDDKLKTRLIETIMLGRAMNPIWTVYNKDEDSEEILDGMHRITTATNFLKNEFKLIGKYLTYQEFNKYSGKRFKELPADLQQKIRNYNFTFNPLDSSYRTNINKRKDMYEILNRSSRTLNDFEFNKVLYNPFYNIISEYKQQFNKFLKKKKDERGNIEMEIISCYVVALDLPKSWSSVNTLIDNYLKKIIGETEEKVNIFLKNNTEEIKNKLTHMTKIIDRLIHEDMFSDDNKLFKKNFLPYKFIICRLAYKLKDISIFNRHIIGIINDLKREVLTVDIQTKLDCKSRNAIFQKKLITLIDKIIDENYNKDDPNNRRLFKKEMINKQLEKQNNKCNKCKISLSNIKYEADHIKPWSSGGLTNEDNLQILCTPCHYKKN